jgi:hypothetical protein
VIEIEFEPPQESDPCECCGGRTTSLTRFVLRDGDAYGVYYARYSDNHPERTVQIAMSLGKWWEGTTPADRTAFALATRSGPENYEVMVCDAETSPWRDVELLGEMLDRQEALEHPLIEEVFRLTDQIVAEDLPLKAYLDGEGDG